MNRRGFLRGLVGGIAITAAEPTWPFRIFSFPKNIVIAKSIPNPQLVETINSISHKYIIPCLADEIFRPSPIWLNLVNKSKLT